MSTHLIFNTALQNFYKDSIFFQVEEYVTVVEDTITDITTSHLIVRK